MKQCLVPCLFVAQHQQDMASIRKHLLEGHQCRDAWVALSKLVHDPQQRKDCLERASILAPDDEELLIAYLEARLTVDPADRFAQQRLNEIRTMRLLSDVKTPYFHEQPKPRLIGDILVSIGAITEAELQEVLAEQRRGSLLVSDRRIGQLLLRRGLITPAKLAKALIIQQQERSRARTAPQVLGEYLVEHGYITAAQLEAVLTEQIRLDQQGKRYSLGQLLVRMNMLSKDEVERAAKEYEKAFWTQFNA
ncbi:hypothetical protein QTO31_01015 [Chloroflexus sp. MS-CIW-1]|jgi:hypothetical protein|uniref:hypothetical protein n=1 Tax=Chloroflexus sp. MS-CIW-1 TaxID=3055768 RepID=UPI0026497A78|nr:hypothetical protein [Chloroflexus sp. MS-CIW-1]MDN5270546.1 hypothetical protein [Chloroflexus sp. MS-CIW-1]